MPTIKPRISITLEAEDLAVLDRYSAASGTPRASMIARLISATIPELERAAQLMELAKAAPAGVVQGLVDDLSNATADAMGFLKPFNDDYQLLLDGLDAGLSAGIKHHEERQRAASRGVPATTRGAGRGRRPPPPDPHLLTGGSNS